MEIRIKGNTDFVRACMYNNDILLQMESSGYITEKWRPFTPSLKNKKICGLVKKTEKGTIIMRD